MSAASVRYIGSIMRQTVQAHYASSGPDFGYRVVRRAMFEFASCVADNNGVEDAVELCYRVGDRIAAHGMAAAGATFFPGEELMPGPRAKLAEVEAEAAVQGPEHTFIIDGHPAVITGDLADSVVSLRKLLSAAEAQLSPPEPEPDPAPPWRIWLRLLWADAKAHGVAALAGFLLGIIVAAPR